MVYLRLNYFLALFLILPLFSCSGSGTADSTSGVPGLTGVPSLSWVAPSEREDGSGLSPSEIAGFRIYYGTESGSYPNMVNVDDHTATEAALADLPSGTYYIVMTTVGTDGLVSAFSGPEVEVTF